MAHLRQGKSHIFGSQPPTRNELQLRWGAKAPYRTRDGDTKRATQEHPVVEVFLEISPGLKGFCHGFLTKSKTETNFQV